MSARRHLLLDSRVGWHTASLAATMEIKESGLALRLRPGSGRDLKDEYGAFGGLVEPTGVAVDAFGRIYILDAGNHRLLRYDPCRCRFEEILCIGGAGSRPRQLRGPQGLAISQQGDILITDTGNRRVQVFSLKSLALRDIWGPYRVVQDDGEIQLRPVPVPHEGRGTAPDSDWPADTWRPWGVAMGPCVVWVSDPGNNLVHRFTPSGRWLGAIDSEQDGTPLLHPTHVTVDCEGRLYVVQDEREYVAVFDSSGRFAEHVEWPREVARRFRPVSVAVARDGTLFLTCCSRESALDDGRRSGVMQLQRYEFGDGVPVPCGTSIPGCGRVMAFDLEGHPLSIDRDRIRILDSPLVYETEGQFVSGALDSEVYRCTWHRVVLSGPVPAGTRIRVETLTSESAKSDSEIAQLAQDRWTLAGEHTRTAGGEWDCLVRSAPGRYLWLRLTLTGDGTESPVLRNVRVEFPRASSLQYLPAVYQQDQESRDFLDRFLSLFDSIRDETGEILDSLAGYFDPLATPATAPSGQSDFLTWLASWIGFSLDQHWPKHKQRALLAQAHRLYALRGTPAGVRLHVKLYTGLEPVILEQFRLRRWIHLGGATLGDCTELWGDDLVKRLQLDVHSRLGEFQLIDTGDPISDPWAYLAHRFSVYVFLEGQASDEQRQTLRRIVDISKPAHTEAELIIVKPSMRIGMQSRVGVDTRIAAYPEDIVAGETELRVGSVLGPSIEEDSRPTFRIGATSRIGTSTLID